MAEKTGELEHSDMVDPIGATAGAVDRADQTSNLGSNYPTTASERRDLEENTGDQPEETEQIRAQIEATRSHMGETIDAIQERLSFSNMSEQVSEQVSNAIETAKDTVYDATIGKVVNYMKNISDDFSNSTAIRTVRSNPFPLVLIGLGAGLLAYQSFGRSNKRSIRGLKRFNPSDARGEERHSHQQATEGSFYGSRTGGAESSSSQSATEFRGKGTQKSVTGKVSDVAGSALSTVSDAASTAASKVSGAVTSAYSGAGSAASRAYETAGEYGTKAQETYEYYLEENPLAVGAVAAALGAAVGFAIPSTRYEGQLMGEARQSLMDKAQAAAGELADRAKNVADQAGQSIKNEAKAMTQ